MKIEPKRAKSLETALRKIKSIFNKQNVTLITIQRKYLPEIFSSDLFKIFEIDGLPILKPFVIDYFYINEITTEFSSNEVKFNYKKDNLIKLKDEI